MILSGWVNFVSIFLLLLARDIFALKGGSDPLRAEIPKGQFLPLFGSEPTQASLPVGKFLIDRFLVTEEDFQKFVAAHSEWTRTSAPQMFVDAHYLKHWDGSAEMDPRAPITHISWFAATTYCEEKGGRLPSTLEWEYVAAASESLADGSKDPKFIESILEWYSKPQKGNIGAIGRSPSNFYGVFDTIGLVWEWTSDFNSFFVTSDNRQQGDRVKNLFCGSGALQAARREDYAAFMRYAMRSSLKPTFSMPNLGFRCAYDVP